MSLSSCRDSLSAIVIRLLWSQWTDLGVAGVRGSGATIVDPEALVLATLHFGRRDPRLFDEVLDWLILNGDLLDVTRLRRLTKVAPPEKRRLARAVIELIRLQGSRSRWDPLAARWTAGEEPASYAPAALFLGGDGSDLPAFGEHDPFFASHGFVRPMLELRGMSSRPRTSRPCLARLAARALVGIGVRAETLLYLSTHGSAHGRLIAARTDHSQRQVSEYLAGLAAAGFADRFEEGRSVGYRLAGADPLGDRALPRYVDWPRAFAALESLHAALEHASLAPDAYETSVRVRAGLERYRAALPVEGIDLPLPKPEEFPGEALVAHAEDVARRAAEAVEFATPRARARL